MFSFLVDHNEDWIKDKPAVVRNEILFLLMHKCTCYFVGGMP